jgi:hypothetical protein
VAYAETLLINIRPSRQLVLYLLLVHGLLAISVLKVFSASGYSAYWLLIALALLISSCVYSLRSTIRIRQIIFNLDGNCLLTMKTGSKHEAVLSSQMYISDFLIILAFTDGNHRRINAIVLRDSIDRVVLKQLRSWLKIGPHGDSVPDSI